MFDKLKGVFARDVHHYFEKGKKCLATDLREALAAFERSAQLGPSNGVLHYEIAEILTRASSNQPELRGPAMKYVEKAINQLDRANPFWDAAHLIRGNLRVHLGKMQEALGDYQKAAGKRPDNPEVYYRRRMALWKLGDFPRAEADMTKALSLGHGSPFVTMFEDALASIKQRKAAS